MKLELTEHQAKQLVAMIGTSNSEPFVVLTQQIQEYFDQLVSKEVPEKPVVDVPSEVVEVTQEPVVETVVEEATK